MSCGVPRERVHAWLDGELSVEAALEAESHARTCAECAAEYRSAVALRQAIRGTSLAAALPDTLEARIRARVGREGRPARPRGVPAWAAVAAALVLGAALGTLLGPLREAIRTRGLDESLVDAHVRALATGPLTQVVSSEQHTVKPWFAGKIDFSPKVKDLAADGFPLKGGRVDRVGRHPAAALAYGRAKHVIDLFVWVGPSAATPPAAARVRGINVVRWTEGDLAYAAVSDLNEAELGAFADLVRR
ncbi:MAG TPA: zf-HC2 domain-containing protein [Thermoanaerobaculia bacterium]|nr:zf-HC2 domain-containing protein [Thermoanaerobaculia bacterium]